MTFDTVIVGSHVILPQGRVEKNIVIDEGKIVKLTNEVPSCDKKINAAGLVSIPGVIDTHVHYGVYSPIDMAATTESHAAAIGGVTTMMRMLRLGGSYKNLLNLQLDASSTTHYVDYAIHASVFNDSQTDEMEFCRSSGVTSFKLYMNLGSDVGHVYMDMQPGSQSLAEEYVEVDDTIVRNVVRTAARLGCPVLVHAEDYEACACGIKTAKKDGQDGLAAWSQSRPPESEADAISRVSEFGREFDCTIYFVHIGSALALEQIRKEREKGTKIFVETCPHYLTLSHEKTSGYLAKVMPPIRTLGDNEDIWNALAGGNIDTVGTDHVANRLELKLGGTDVWGALAGFPGIGTALPLLLSEGVNRGRLSLERLVSVTSANAAKIFSMPSKGSFQSGSDADVTIIDLNLEKKVSSDLFGGFSDYLVYENWKLKGWPIRTIVRGKTVAKDFEVVGDPGHGRLVERSVK